MNSDKTGRKLIEVMTVENTGFTLILWSDGRDGNQVQVNRKEFEQVLREIRGRYSDPEQSQFEEEKDHSMVPEI